MVKTNIRGDLRKYKPKNSKPKSSSITISENVVHDFIPSSISMSIGLQQGPVLKLQQIEDPPLEATETKLLISPFKRTVYFGECGHKAHTYINTVTLNSYYYCVQCVLWRKVQEVVY